ncbi:MAG: hypothetical protein KY445_00900, partial [Armatimonadetes bacterium]|nr:hypothetical protein [Armatimonadota bacterium]
MSQVFNYDCSEEEWAAFIAARDSGEVTEIDEEMWMYWLELLPPIYMNRRVEIAGKPRCAFGFAEGYDNIIAFWREQGRFFCARTEE